MPRILSRVGLHNAWAAVPVDGVVAQSATASIADVPPVVLTVGVPLDDPSCNRKVTEISKGVRSLEPCRASPLSR